MLESGGEKTQPVPQKQRKNACMAVLPLTIVIAVGGCVGEMVFDGIISGDHMINNAYAEESVLLVTNEIAMLLANDTAARDFFGRSVSVYNNTAVIGASADDDKGSNSGSAYVFEKNSTGHWTQKQKLLASDGTVSDYFGRSVSVYNNTAVIGADYDDDNGIRSGSAYVFEKNSTGHWTQKQKLLASDGGISDYFGNSVSVYNNTAVIGASADDNNNKTNSGSAYVFEKNSTSNWTQKQKLLASDGAISDYFGGSVSVYNNTAVIGASADDNNNKTNSGSAYVFEKNSTSGHWTQKAKLLASDGAISDYFGFSVSLSSNTAVIGAYQDDDNGSDSGSAYVFEKNSTSGHWTQKAKLVASDAEAHEYFGYSVSLSSNTAVIGASADDNNNKINSGSAYVFEKNSTGHWTQKAKLLTSHGRTGDLFGGSVSVYNNTAVIGAFLDDDNGPASGSAYVFEYSSATWTQKAKLLASDTTVSDYFGFSVSVYNNTAVIGAYDDDDNGNSSGSAYVFEYSSATWTQKAKLLADDADADDSFGYSVSVYNNTAVIGAHFDDDNGPDSGSAYVFEKNSTGHWTQKAKLLASHGRTGDHLGGSVSVYNNTAVIGASADDNNNKTNSGSAYVFEYSSATWTQKAKLLADDADADDSFGYSVSVYNNTAVIGAYRDDSNGSDSGSAYVFEKNSTGHWTQKAKLLASDGAVSDYFGGSVSVYNNTAVIGASADDNNNKTNSGSAYVFEYSSATWTQKAKLLASDGAVSDYFGSSVSVYNNTAVIGADFDDDDSNGSDSGSAYVFEKNSTSGHWTQKAKLVAIYGRTGDHLGGSVSVYNNTAVIGAIFDDDNGLASGAAYVFTISANQVPTANAGDDQTVDEGTKEVTLDGTGSADPNDDAITYLWSQTKGPTVTLSSSTSASPMFTTPTVTSNQTLTFSLTVNDGAVDSTPDTVDITIQNTINESPTANAGDDQTVSEGDNVTLDGTGSADPNGDTLTYLWSQTKGPTVTLSSSTLVSPTFDAPTVTSEQTLTFSLVVTDDLGADSANNATVDITIQNTINESPTANAGDDQTVSEGDNVTLDGTGSADPNGDTLTYAWSQTKGPTVTLSSSTLVSPTFDAPTVTSEQTLTFSLVVTDDLGADSANNATVDITIQNTINESPTANAGDDQTVSEGDNVTLDGTGSADPNGDTLTYAWSQTKGSTVTLSSSTLVSPTFDAPTVTSEQTLTFSLVVTDDLGADSANNATVDITIQNTINESPTANAGDDQTVSEGDNVTLDGTGSADPNGDTLTYAWSQTKGPTVTLSSSTLVSPTFDAPTVTSEQTLTFSLVVTDDLGADSANNATVDITIQNTINESPTANAGDDQTVSEGDNVTLDGTGSADPNGDTLTYLWSQTKGPTVTLSSSTLVSPTFDAPTVTSEQTLTFSLVVTDDLGADSANNATVDITIQNTINESPTANAGDDQTVSEGDNVTLDGTGSADPNGDTLTYLWSQTKGPTVTLSSSTLVSPTFDAPTVTSEQTLTFSLVVTDDLGADSANNATVDITIQNTINESPTANAGDDQTVSEGDNVTLDGTGSADPNGDTLTYAWSQTKGPTVTLSSSTLVSPTFDAPTVTSEQTLTFSLVVTDDLGADSANNATVDITIQNTINESPTANAGDDQTVSEGDNVTLDGTGSADPNGDTLTYAWSQTKGPTVTLSSSTLVSPTFDAPTVTSEQTLTFSLVVTDDLGADSANNATVDITIQNTINESPTANAGDDQTVSEGDNVTLDGTGSADPNGDTLTYAWSQTKGPTVTLSSSTLVSPTFDAPTVTSEQTLTFSLVVTDDLGADSANNATVDITIQNTINESPTANAGDDQTVSEGDNVTLDGTGSADPNGDTLTYAWSQTKGPTVTLSSSTLVSPTFDAPTVTSEQTLTFSLVVTDDLGADSANNATVDITIQNTINESPTANAGDDQTVSEGDNVTLDGTGSADPNGDTLTYLWSQTKGSTVTLSSSTLVSPTFDAPTVTSEQTLTFSLVVTDDLGADSANNATVDITIQNTINESPTANAGDDQTVSEGDNVTLDGTGSADPNGDTLTYLWSQTKGSTVTLSSSTLVSPTFDAPTVTSEQTLTFSLVVTDDLGADSANNATVDITIQNTINESPTANAGDDQTVSEGDNVTLDGTGSADPNGDTLTYAWSQTKGPTVTLSSSTLVSPTFDAPTVTSEQTLTFSLVVTDDLGADSANNATVDITIQNTINESPTANAGDDQTVSEGDNVTLDGTGSADPNGDTLTYLWSQTKGPTVTLSSSTLVSPTFDAPTVTSEQTLTFSLVVTDDLGADSANNATVDITIQNTINESPTANAGDDQTVSEGDNVTLDGTGSADPNGDTLTYAWSQTKGPTVTLSSSTLVSPTFDAPTVTSEQTLTFSLVVTDDLGADSANNATVDITIQNTINESPTANAGDDQTVSEGDNVTLDGTGSADPNGDTLTYAWSQTKGPTVTLSSSTLVSPTFDAPTVTSEQTLTFSLVVTDDLGADSANNATVDITIQNTINESPTANAGDDQTVSEGDNVTLDGTGSADPNGDTLTYLWSQTKGPTVTLSSSTLVSPTFDAPTVTSEQTLTFSLVVTDDLGADSANNATVDITIQNTINESPTANAGDDQTVSEGDNVTLDGTGSADPNGDTLTYAWSQTKGSTVTLSSSTLVSPTFDAPTVTSEQTLTFSLVVTDDLGADSANNATVDITIQNTINESPTANAGDDQTVSEGDNVTLDGTGSADPNGDTLTYAWSQTKGSTVTLSSSTLVSPTFDAPTVTSEQTLTFSLVVTDDLGADSANNATVDITIQNTINESPTANAGDDQTVSEGDNVTLDGTGSADPNGDTLTYAWSQTKGPTVTLSSSTLVSPTFDAPTVTSEQTLTFSLVVTDDLGADSANNATVDITIQNTINESPTANAGDDQTVSEGDNVTLDGTGSADPNGDTLTYAWSQTKGSTVTLSSSTLVSPTFDAPTVTSEQTLTFSLTVNDGAVNSTPDTVNITVLDTDDVLLTSPGSPSGSSGSSSSGSSSSGIGTSGGGGGGGSGSSIWVYDIYLKSVSWDCNAGTIKIIAGPDSDYLSVTVRTTQLGIHQASITGDDIPGYRAFVSPMHKTEDYINIKAVALSGRNLVTISESIDVDACVGERTYHAPDDSTTTTIKQPVPKQEDDKDRLADFVDPKKNPQYYIDRYNNEIEYREWFDENYPGITIYEAVGLPVPDPTLEPAVEQEPTAVEQEPTVDPEPETICGPGTEPVDGFCILLTPGPEENGGGCLIATAAYGTELAPQVQLLREIRDNTVLQTQSGSAFIDSFNSFYYSFSPSIADLERQNPVFREAVKMAVTPLISSLVILDYVDIDSESEMLGYGIGIVAMNIAMYVALPVSALYYVRRLVA